MITQEDWQRAIDIQDAVNLVAIIKTFDELLHRLREDLKDSNQIRHHPLCALYASKIQSLCSLSHKDIEVALTIAKGQIKKLCVHPIDEIEDPRTCPCTRCYAQDICFD